MLTSLIRKHKIFVNKLALNNYKLVILKMNPYYNHFRDYRNESNENKLFKQHNNEKLLKKDSDLNKLGKYLYSSCSSKNSSEDGKNGKNKETADINNNHSDDDKGGDNDKKDEYKSLIRNNYHSDCQEALNKQINKEFYAAYWYCSLQYYFNRENMGLPGFVEYFKENATEELSHAEKLMTFQRKRGGELKFYPVDSPPDSEWTVETALLASIKIEMEYTQLLEAIAKLACDKEDHHLNDYICTEFLTEQYQGVKDMADLLSRVRRAGPRAGLVLVDEELLNHKLKKPLNDKHK